MTIPFISVHAYRYDVQNDAKIKIGITLNLFFFAFYLFVNSV